MLLVLANVVLLLWLGTLPMANGDDPLFNATIQMADNLPYFLGSNPENPFYKVVPSVGHDPPLSADSYSPPPCSSPTSCPITLGVGVDGAATLTLELLKPIPPACLSANLDMASADGGGVYPTSCTGSGNMGLAVPFKLEGPAAGSITLMPDVARWKPGSPAGTKVNIAVIATNPLGALDMVMLRIGQGTSNFPRQAMPAGRADFTEVAFVGSTSSFPTEISDTKNACRSTGAATHTSTFDGNYWHPYLGDSSHSRAHQRITYFKSTVRDFVVQVQKRGGGKAGSGDAQDHQSPVCAMAGREGNDWVMFDTCKGSMRAIANFHTKRVDDLPRIDVQGNTYAVFFKSGAWMRAAHVSSTLMNVFAGDRAEAPGSMCGICGNGDGVLSGTIEVRNYKNLRDCQKVSSKEYPTATPCKDGPNSGESPSCDIWDLFEKKGNSAYAPPPPPPLPLPPPDTTDPLVVTCPPGSFVLPASTSASGFAECRPCNVGVTYEPYPNTLTTCSQTVSAACNLTTQFEQNAPTTSSDRICGSTTTTTATSTTATSTTATSTTTTLSAAELKAAAAKLRAEGKTASDLLNAGFPPKVMVLAGYTKQELIDSGVDPNEIDTGNGENDKPGSIAGIAVAIVLVILGCIVGAVVLVKRRRANAANMAGQLRAGKQTAYKNPLGNEAMGQCQQCATKKSRCVCRQRAESIAQGKIPKLATDEYIDVQGGSDPNNQPWFARGMDRGGCKARVLAADRGCFLVRVSRKTPGAFAFCINLGNGRVQEDLAKPDSTGRLVLSFGKGARATPAFPDILSLVKYCQTNSIVPRLGISLQLGSAAPPLPVYGAITTAPSEATYSCMYGQVDSGLLQFYKRFVVTEHEIYKPRAENPLAALEAEAVVSFEEAIRSAEHHCGTLQAFVAARRSFVANNAARLKTTGITDDGITVIYMYTAESNLYKKMNASLGNYGNDPDPRANVVHYLPYIKLLNASLTQLPKVNRTVVYRGVNQPAAVLLNGAKVGDTITWWSFTSTTPDVRVLRQKAFLNAIVTIGADGKVADVHNVGFYEDVAAGHPELLEEKTIFQINICSGVNVAPFSAIPTEDEILLLAGSNFLIKEIKTWRHGITEVQMIQIDDDDAGGKVANDSNFNDIDVYMALEVTGESDGSDIDI